MFGLPAQTFWWLCPWPIIWTALALYIYWRMNREDQLEEQLFEEKGDK